jgi:ABC-type branched-subunit amino acid transport system substrate-binding protein
MSRIFISYRRVDSITITGRIHDRLVGEFDDKTVFKDVDDIPLGADFRTVLDEEVGRCAVQLVIIGPDWLNVPDENGSRRLDDPDDFVRIEVESGLRRDEVLVVPVLVGGAAMPGSSQLPPSLRDLAYRNAAIIRDDPDFHRDMGRLIHQIQQHFDQLDRLDESPADPPPLASEPVSAPPDDPPTTAGRALALPSMRIMAAIAFVTVMALIIIGSLVGGDSDDGYDESEDSTASAVGGDQTVLIGVALDADDDVVSQDILRAVQLMADERPGIIVGGYSVSWEILSVEGDCGDDSLGMAEEFINEERLIGVVGHACAEGCANTLFTYEDAGYLAVSPVCDDSTIAPLDNPNFIRTIHPSMSVSQMAAYFSANYLGSQTVITIHDDQEENGAAVTEFVEWFTGFGGEIPHMIATSGMSASDVLHQVEQYDVQAVFYAGEVAFAADMFNENTLLQERGIAFLFANGGEKHELADALADYSDVNVFAFYPEPFSLEDAPEFVAYFTDVYGEPPQTLTAVYAYEAVGLLLDVFQDEAWIDDGDVVAFDRHNLNERARHYEGEGVLEWINCSDDGDCRQPIVRVFHLLEDGNYEDIDVD